MSNNFAEKGAPIHNLYDVSIEQFKLIKNLLLDFIRSIVTMSTTPVTQSSL